MLFDEYLIPYNWSVDWIDKKLDEMVLLMNQTEIPESNESCRNWHIQSNIQKFFKKNCKKVKKQFSVQTNRNHLLSAYGEVNAQLY